MSTNFHLQGMRGGFMPRILGELWRAGLRVIRSRKRTDSSVHSGLGQSSSGGESLISERMKYQPQSHTEIQQLKNKLESGSLSAAELDELDRAAVDRLDPTSKPDPALLADIDAWMKDASRPATPLTPDGQSFYRNLARELAAPRGGKVTLPDDGGTKR